MSLLLLLMAMGLISSASAYNQEMTLALSQMQEANYFAFVMLLNMAPPDLIQSNITFLMPNDRALSTANIAETSIVDFLLNHSIPWPLLIDHIQHVPTGSMIPTSRPGYMLKFTNDGTSRLFLNNARIVSPNICTTGSSIRCLGVDGVVQSAVVPDSCSRCPSSVSLTSSPSPPNTTAVPQSPPSLAGVSSVPKPKVATENLNTPKSTASDHHQMGSIAAGAVNLVAMLVFLLGIV